ncbi:AAA family ATPase [Rhizobium laguerreae]|nr:AAA family ATPase [Rhizobium laguerreae]
MTLFNRQGGNWFIASGAPEITDRLPAGTYLLNGDPENGFYLSEVDDFTLPEKTYGKEIERHERIINTFLSRHSTTGVILAGEKGSGKTLLSKRVSIELAKQHGIPTIIINAPHKGDAFNQYIQAITQPALVILDEFEKVYDPAAQNALLTVLDGTMQSKKLFIVAINDISKMNPYMLNRPGRFFYVYKYSGVSEDAIHEYLLDNLADQSRLDSVISYTQLFRSFTFDMLSAIVEEMNRYDEPINEVMKNLNVSMDFGGGDYYEVLEVVLKRPVDDKFLGWDESSVKKGKRGRPFNDGEAYNPFQDAVSQIVFLRFAKTSEPTDDDEEDYYGGNYEHYRLTPNDIVKAEKGGFFTFETEALTMRIGKRTAEVYSAQNVLRG